MRRPLALRALVVALVVSVALGVVSVSAVGAPIVRTPGHPSYEFRLRSGEAGRTWQGSGSITFTNVGSDPLPEIYLRVWSNGVQGCAPRAIVVSNVQGGTLSGEALECTELEITLDDALAQGETATISFDLAIRLPDEDDRFGFHRGLALAGSALPILAVHDDAGWHHVPFENLGESFYSVAGDYRVTFVTPPALGTAASGIVTGRRETNAGGVRTTYTAEKVRNFAWAAGRLRTVRRSKHGVDVVVSYQPEAVRRARARAVADDSARIMARLALAYGRYPYPEVDVVLAGFGRFGGMEYGTIVFSQPGRGTIAHELAHQWFFGIVGNDEYREPWLDESFAAWAGREVLGPSARCRGISWPSPQVALTNDMAYWAAHPGHYWVVYRGGACMLTDLSRRFGHDRFRRIVGRYVRGHRLGIARTEDFMARIETAAARHLDGFDAAAYWSRWRVDPS
jgi:hypothetical protein